MIIMAVSICVDNFLFILISSRPNTHIWYSAYINAKLREAVAPVFRFLYFKETDPAVSAAAMDFYVCRV